MTSIPKNRFAAIFPIGDATQEGETALNTFEVEPADILGVVPLKLLNLGNDLWIVISDGESWYEYTIDSFMQKKLKYRKGALRIGQRWMRVNELRITVGAKITCYDMTALENPKVD